jgi:hypothetical protein
MIPACRAGLPMQVFPDQDTLVCDPSADVSTHHLLTACASQNYGSNSYRIRQPFDFAGRTGKIVFDAAVTPYGGLFGWVSLEVTEEPIANPSFETQLNYEGGVRPRNAFEVQFDAACPTSGDGAMGVGTSGIHVFTDYVDAPVTPPQATGCPATYQPGKMNHFEVLVSQTSIEVHVSPFSTDGVTFGAPAFSYQTPVNLPFSRGYVHITLHNHASLKYGGGFGVPNQVDATIAVWDNVGFDGPIVTSWREYEVPDSLVPITGFVAVNAPSDPFNPSGKAVSTGYLVPDASMGPAATLHLSGVDPSNATAARLVMTAWYLGTATAAQYTLSYRFNGGTWRDHQLSAAEAALFTVPPGIQGALGHAIDVPVTDLRAGDNTLDVVTKNVPQNYPPAIANIDLVLTTQ